MVLPAETSIRRKGWANVVRRVRGQPCACRGANQLEVDIEVVLLIPIPRESHLIAVRGRAWGLPKTRIAGERDTSRAAVVLTFSQPKTAKSETDAEQRSAVLTFRLRD